MATRKTGPNDGGYDEKNENKKVNNIDELSNEEKKRLKATEKDEKFQKEMDELEEVRKAVEERRRKKLEELKKREVKTKKQIREEEESKVSGQITKRRTYKCKKGKGIFIGGKSKNYIVKMNKAFKKIHGVSSEKKKGMVEFMGLGAKMKSKITEKEVDIICRGLKHRKFDKPPFKNVFKKMKKEGVDLKKYKKDLKARFGSKKDIAKFSAALKGEDPRRYKMKRTSNRSTDRIGKVGSDSARVRVGKRF